MCGRNVRGNDVRERRISQFTRSAGTAEEEDRVVRMTWNGEDLVDV